MVPGPVSGTGRVGSRQARAGRALSTVGDDGLCPSHEWCATVRHTTVGEWQMTSMNMLASWNDTPVKRAIIAGDPEFLGGLARHDPDAVSSLPTAAERPDVD